MLIEAVGMFAIIAGVLAFASVCVWSFTTLKEKTGSVFSLSVIAGVFVFYHLVVKIGNGDAAFHNYVIGLIALAIVALDAYMTYQEHGGKVALARVVSSIYGVLAVLAYMGLFYNRAEKQDKNKK